MKKIISLILCLTTVILAGLSLVSCSSKGDLPEDMRLVGGSDALGFYFYGPEEWVVANRNNIYTTYASKLDTSSMTFAKAEKPEGTIQEYFDAHKDGYVSDITVTAPLEKTTFGNSTNAYKVVFTYEYNEKSLRCMQIFVYFGESFYIFTYNSYDDERTAGQSYYDFYMTKVLLVIQNFKFITPNGETEPTPEYEKDEDGYMLVSDRVLCGFDMYVPEEYDVEFSSGFVSVKNENGSNINMGRATYTEVYFIDYWNKRKEDLSRIVDKITDDGGEEIPSIVELQVNKVLTAGKPTNASIASLFEYTYLLDGVKYHVYQVIMASPKEGYVYTFTATEDNYDNDLNEALSVLEKMVL